MWLKASRSRREQFYCFSNIVTQKTYPQRALQKPRIVKKKITNELNVYNRIEVHKKKKTHQLIIFIIEHNTSMQQ